MVMTAIHEIQQALIVDTEFGKCHALFIIDYGIHENTIWVCASFKDGKIRHFDSNQVRLETNYTLNFNTDKKQENGKRERKNSESKKTKRKTSQQ